MTNKDTPALKDRAISLLRDKAEALKAFKPSKTNKIDMALSIARRIISADETKLAYLDAEITRLTKLKAGLTSVKTMSKQDGRNSKETRNNIIKLLELFPPKQDALDETETDKSIDKLLEELEAITAEERNPDYLDKEIKRLTILREKLNKERG